MMHKKKSGERSYADQFVLFTIPIDKWLKRLIFGFLLLLIIVQVLMQFKEIRYYLSSVERLEGVPVQINQVE